MEEAVADYVISIAEQLLAKRDAKQKSLYDKKIAPLVENFIRDNNYLVKNNMILRKIDPSVDVPEPDHYYYEVYTDPDGRSKLRKFADKLYEMNDPELIYIEVERIREYTFDLKNNFKTILRITALSKPAFNRIMFKTTKGRLRYIDPNLMRLQVYDDYCDPTLSVKYWKSAYMTEQALNKIFPLKGRCEKKSIDKPILNNIFNQIIVDNNNIILADNAVYNILMKIMKISDLMPVNYFVILSQQPDNEIKKLKSLLGNNDIKINKERHGLKYFRERLLVYYKKVLVLIIYDVSDKCYPYTQLTRQLKIATVHLLIKFYLIEYMFNKGQRSCIEHKINAILKDREVYLKQKGLTGISPGPLQTFHHTCFGKQKNIQRELMIAATKREFSKYRYKPGVSQ